jgi:hypothetical protein
MSKQRFSETVTFGEICIYDMDAFDVARALRRDGINRKDREQVRSYLGPLASETWIRVCMADWKFLSYGLGVEGRVSADAIAQAGLKLKNFHFVLAQGPRSDLACPSAWKIDSDAILQAD